MKLAFKSVPAVFSFLLLMAGALLLVSGALPAVPQHIRWLREIVPLPFVEVSHLAGSIAGVFLLFLARGIWLRLDAAYYSCIIVLAIGAVASLLKGFDWREALILLTMLLVLLPTRSHFYRRASLFTMPFTVGWIVLIGTILVGSAALGFAAYSHIPYVHDIWWKFSYRDDAPRFLRALFVTGLVVVAYILNSIYAVSRPKPGVPPTEQDLIDARAIAAKSHDTVGFLGLLGDKSLLWSPSRQAFIMYARTPRYWIAMGDPVGEPEEYSALVWRFREQADRDGAHAVFYEVSDRHLPLYLDCGLALLKMGEEARIPLKSFTLEGGKREGQRKTRNKLSKTGYTVRVLELDEVARVMPELRRISDAWMAGKKAHEKGFSLGFFSEHYVAHTRVAVAEKDGRIYAFANIWELDNKESIAVDLMRYDPESPTSMMEYLFIECILWARENGYQWFNLGMAPLSGMEKHDLAPLWHKIGRIIFEHGEDFYNFEGLKAYKSKFDPAWRPRYLATPTGLRIPMVLLAVAGIIGGGVRGMLRK